MSPQLHAFQLATQVSFYHFTPITLIAKALIPLNSCKLIKGKKQMNDIFSTSYSQPIDRNTARDYLEHHIAQHSEHADRATIASRIAAPRHQHIFTATGDIVGEEHRAPQRAADRAL